MYLVLKLIRSVATVGLVCGLPFDSNKMGYLQSFCPKFVIITTRISQRLHNYGLLVNYCTVRFRNLVILEFL